jgi:C-terminal processing protease CtpA/Prc
MLERIYIFSYSLLYIFSIIIYLYIKLSTFRGKEDTKISIRIDRQSEIIDLNTLRKPIKLTGVEFTRFDYNLLNNNNNKILNKDFEIFLRNIYNNNNNNNNNNNGNKFKNNINFGLIKIKSFSSTTNVEVTKAMENFYAEFFFF